MKNIIYAFLLVILFTCCADNNENQTKTEEKTKETIIPKIEESLNVKFSLETETTNDPVLKKSYQTETFSVEMQGINFESNMDLISKIQSIFENENYTPNLRYAADGPDGTGFAYTKGKIVYIINIHWEPTANYEVPEDEPIDYSNVPPEDMTYTIEIVK